MFLTVFFTKLYPRRYGTRCTFPNVDSLESAQNLIDKMNYGIVDYAILSYNEFKIKLYQKKRGK